MHPAKTLVLPRKKNNNALTLEQQWSFHSIDSGAHERSRRLVSYRWILYTHTDTHGISEPSAICTRATFFDENNNSPPWLVRRRLFRLNSSAHIHIHTRILRCTHTHLGTWKRKKTVRTCFMHRYNGFLARREPRNRWIEATTSL